MVARDLRVIRQMSMAIRSATEEKVSCSAKSNFFPFSGPSIISRRTRFCMTYGRWISGNSNSTGRRLAANPEDAQAGNVTSLKIVFVLSTSIFLRAPKGNLGHYPREHVMARLLLIRQDRRLLRPRVLFLSYPRSSTRSRCLTKRRPVQTSADAP